MKKIKKWIFYFIVMMTSNSYANIYQDNPAEQFSYNLNSVSVTSQALYNGRRIELNSSSYTSNKPSFHLNALRPIVTFSSSFSVIQTHGNTQAYNYPDESFIYFNSRGTVFQKNQSGVFLGLELPYTTNWHIQTGISYYQSSSFDITGLDTQGITNSPDTFTRFNYKYNVILRQTLIEGKLLYNWHEKFHPYVSLGLGVASNTASNYSVNNPPFLIFSPEYNHKTTTSFSYRLGFGLGVDLTDNLRFGIGYAYSNFGNINTGTGVINNTRINGNLKSSNIHTNQILGELTLLS